MTFNDFRAARYTMPPGDCPWNSWGFKNDYTHPQFSEMSAHLPLLEYFASQCNHVTEFGTRSCNSTVAFLTGAKKKVVSYDIQPTPSIMELMEMKNRGELPCEWEFVCKSTSNPNIFIEDTDFLFVDTLHTFAQVQQELKLHADKVNKWIGFHDVFSQGLASLDSPGTEGINRAIKEFIDTQKCWKVIYHVPFNHGLLLIERTGEKECES